MKSTSINLMLQNNFHSKRQCSNCIKRENQVLSLVRSLTKGKASCWMDANVDNVQVCGYQKKKHCFESSGTPENKVLQNKHCSLLG